MTHTTPKPRRKLSLRRIRPWVQGLFVLAWLGPHAMTWLFKGADAAKTLKARLHQIPGCTFHCYACPLATFACPIGVIASMSAVHLIPLLAIGVIVVVGSLVGSMACGWACPAGFMQDLLAKVPLPKVRIPNWMGFGRYAVLIILVVTVPLIWGKEDNPAFICRLCPVGGIEAAIPNALMPDADVDTEPVEGDEAIGIVAIPFDEFTQATTRVPAEYGRKVWPLRSGNDTIMQSATLGRFSQFEESSSDGPMVVRAIRSLFGRGRPKPAPGSIEALFSRSGRTLATVASQPDEPTPEEAEAAAAAAAALAVADMPVDESSISISNLKLTIVVLFVAGALFMRRPWCTILCPLGGMLSLFNRVSVVHLRFSRKGCTECNRCRTNCPYGVHLDKRINDTRCNRCLECTTCGGISTCIGGKSSA